MLVRSLDQVYEITAKILNCSEEVVREVVNHYFSYIRKSLTTINSASINVPHIGTFYMAKSNYTGALKLMIRTLRNSRLNEAQINFFKEQFRILWKSRHLVKEYYISNKKLSPFKNVEYR